MKKLAIQACLIVVLALAVAGLDGAVRGLSMPERPASSRPDVLARARDAASERQRQAASAAETTTPETAMLTPEVDDSDALTADDVDFLINEGLAIPIDARTAAEFRAGHIPTAMHMTLEMFTGGALPEEIMMLSEIQMGMPDMTLIVYCDGGDCHASEAVGAKLMEFGLQNVYIFEGGYPEWTEAGLPVEEGGSIYQ